MPANGNGESHNGSSTSSQLHALEKHSKYYIPTGDLSFLVQHIHFKVHKYFFVRESEYFVANFASPATPGSPARGSADAHAIVLEDVTPDEFARFLWVFYNERYSIYDATVSDWEIVLRLAARWAFPQVHALAVRELEKATMPDVERITLYHANNVDKVFLIPRYAALCARPTPLTIKEGRLLGLETCLMIATGREAVRAVKGAGGARSPVEPTLATTELEAVIREIFEIKETSPSADSSSTGPVPLPKETKEEGSSTSTKPQRPAVQTAPPPATDLPLPTPKTQKQPQTPAAKKPAKTATQKPKAAEEKRPTTPTTTKKATNTNKVDVPSPVLKDAEETKAADKGKDAEPTTVETQVGGTEAGKGDKNTAGSNSSAGPDTSALLVDVSGGNDGNSNGSAGDLSGSSTWQDLASMTNSRSGVNKPAADTTTIGPSLNQVDPKFIS